MSEQSPYRRPQAPSVQVPPPQPVAAGSQSTTDQTARVNPGKTLGVAGIIANILMFYLLGLGLGVASLTKSKEAGAPKALGIVNVIWGTVGLFSNHPYRCLHTSHYIWLNTRKIELSG